jgi:hypothetical protein
MLRDRRFDIRTVETDILPHCGQASELAHGLNFIFPNGVNVLRGHGNGRASHELFKRRKVYSSQKGRK